MSQFKVEAVKHHYQKPYMHDPPRTPCVVLLEDRHAEILRQWADDEKTSVSALLAEFLKPITDMMDNRARPRRAAKK